MKKNPWLWEIYQGYRKIFYNHIIIIIYFYQIDKIFEELIQVKVQSEFYVYIYAYMAI